MKVLVMGATGRAGLATVKQLLASGHRVTAFSPSAGNLPLRSDRLLPMPGDVLDPRHVDRAVTGQDAVIVTLGTRAGAWGSRLLGGDVARDVRSTGTRHIVVAMYRRGVRRLVVLSRHGVFDVEHRRALGALRRWTLSPELDDMERQEIEVRQSELEWVIARAVALTDEDDDARPLVSTDSRTVGGAVSRNSVGRFLVEAATGTAFVGEIVSLSAAPRPEAIAAHPKADRKRMSSWRAGTKTSTFAAA